jgi:hypothetical protein
VVAAVVVEVLGVAAAVEVMVVVVGAMEHGPPHAMGVNIDVSEWKDSENKHTGVL